MAEVIFILTKILIAGSLILMTILDIIRAIFNLEFAILEGYLMMPFVLGIIVWISETFYYFIRR